MFHVGKGNGIHGKKKDGSGEGGLMDLSQVTVEAEAEAMEVVEEVEDLTLGQYTFFET